MGLPLLKEAMNYRDSLAKKMDVSKAELLLSLHYPGTTAKFHIHITHISHEHNKKVFTWPLQTIISNLEINPLYYQLATLELSNSHGTKVAKLLYSAADRDTGKFKENAPEIIAQVVEELKNKKKE